MKWVCLLIAIVAEVAGTSALKASQGFTVLLPSAIVALGYVVAYYFLSLTLDRIPVGIAYALWSGIGIVFISAVGWLWFGQTLDTAAMIGIALIVADNRAGVERVMGFCTEEEARWFLELIPDVERTFVESGIILLKYWLEVSQEEQARRLEARIHDGRKIWKLSPMDLKSYSRWYDYSRARDDMFKASDTPWAPWYVVRSDNKKRARLNAISHLLQRIPYEELPRAKIKLPERQKPQGYRESDYPFKFVPDLTWPST